LPHVRRGSLNVGAAGVPTGLRTISCAPDAPSCLTTTGSFFLRTDDGGRDWRALPSHEYAEAISCVDSLRCWAVGSDVVSATSDGGESWTSQTLPGSPALIDIACPDAEHCWAIGVGSTGIDAVIFGSPDGGLHWELQSAEPGIVLYGLDCTDARRCVAVGTSGTAVNTVDGGRRWTSHRLPSELPDALAVTCVGRDHCWAMGNAAIAASSDGGSTWQVQAVATDLQITGGLDCLDRRTCVAVGTNVERGVGVILATTDGGETWIERAAPESVSGLNDVACSTAIGCRAVGQIAADLDAAPYGAAVLAYKRPQVLRPVRPTARIGR
jgi:photosystem II stability/assembly factor-like uncharacterized protein